MTKKTIPFSFDENYNFIANKFKQAGYDTQVGSNNMQLVTAMSYLISMLNANTAININETILSLCTKRNMALHNSRTLGYEIEHMRSYRYECEIELNNNTNDEKIFTIPQFTPFNSNGNTYYYLGSDINETVQPKSVKTIKIEVREGTLRKFDEFQSLNFVVNTTLTPTGDITVNNYLDVPFRDVEEDGIFLFLTYYDGSGNFHNNEEWTKSSTFLIDSDTVLNKQYVRLDDIDFRTPRLHFKIGDVGTELRVGTIVRMNVLQSKGSEGAASDKMSFGESPLKSNVINFESRETISGETTKVLDFSNMNIKSYKLIMTGANEEDLESIKENAPMFHNTANRVITKPDYIAFCNRNAYVNSTSVWDGNDEYPHQRGHIWFSFIPSITRRLLSPSDVSKTTFTMDNLNTDENWYIDYDGSTVFDNIKEYLDYYKVPTLIFHHRNPVFVDFTFECNIVKYSAATTRADTHQMIFDVIDNYFKEEIEQYESEFLMSNLIKRMDEELTDGIGINVSLLTNITLSKLDIINDDELEFDQNGKIFLHLSPSFEPIVKNDLVVVENLPSIETFNFVGNLNVYTDFTSKSTDVYGRESYDIRLGSGNQDKPKDTDKIIGKYNIKVKSMDDIEIVFEDVEGYFEDYERLTLNVKYPTPNLQTMRNSIPRLKRVEFIQSDMD